METPSSKKTQRPMAVVLLIMAGAMLASLLATTATAQASSRGDLATEQPTVAELTPDEWDCIINYEAEHVMICLMLKEKSDNSATAAVEVSSLAAVPTQRGPGDGAPDQPIFCLPGYYPILHEFPIYDSDGIFVVDWETKWVCIPDDLEPAG